MKYSITAVLAIASFAIMMTSSTSAYAQSTVGLHAVDPVPGGGFTGDLFQLQSVGAADNNSCTIDPTPPCTPDTAQIVITMTFVYLDTTGNFGPPPNPEPDAASNLNPVAICTNVVPGSQFLTSINDRMWVYRDNDSLVGSIHPLLTAGGSTILYESTANAGEGFGSGFPSSPDLTQGSQNALFFDLDNGQAGFYEIDSSGNILAGQFDSTAQAGNYFLVACGYVDANGNGDWGGFNVPGAESRSVEFIEFIIQQTVGGEMMPISTTSLLVAGAGANALWILPILGLAGTIIAIRKLQA